MPYSHVHSHYHLNRMKSMPEMSRIYWCHSIGMLGSSLVAIFVPIFLLKSGFTFRQVLLYLLLQQLFSAFLQYPAGRLLQYVWPHHQLALGQLSNIVFYLLLATLPSHHWPLALLALVWTLNRTLYWSAFHYCFSSARAHEHGGRQIARSTALTMFAQTTAPALGGIIASLANIRFVYGVAVVVIAIAIVPMLKVGHGPARTRMQINRDQIWAMRRDALANFSNGIVVTAETSLWPLVVFLIVTSYAAIGILSSFIAFASIAVTLYVGRKQETNGEGYYIHRGLASYSLTSIGRSIVQNATQVFGLNLLGGMSRSLYVTPFMNRYYKNSDGNFRLGYITVMETSFAIGNILYLSILLLLSLWLPIQIVLTISMTIAAVVVLGVRAIR